MIINLDHCIWLYQIIHNLLSFLVFLPLIIGIKLILILLTYLIFYLSTLLFILGPSRYFTLLKCCIIFSTIDCHLIYNYPSAQSRWWSPCSLSFQTLWGLIASCRSDQRGRRVSAQLCFLWPWRGIFKIYAYLVVMPWWSGLLLLMMMMVLLLGSEVGIAGESLVHLEQFKVLLWTETICELIGLIYLNGRQKLKRIISYSCKGSKWSLLEFRIDHPSYKLAT